MMLNVSANAIIDNLISEFDEIAHTQKSIPRGSFIAPGSEYERLCQVLEQAERKLTLASDLLGVDIYGILRAARRWYTRCEWQRCLPDDVAAHLISFYAVNPRKDELADKRPGTIAEWAERNRRWKATA